LVVRLARIVNMIIHSHNSRSLKCNADNCDSDNWSAKHCSREVSRAKPEVIHWDCIGPNIPTTTQDFTLAIN